MGYQVYYDENGAHQDPDARSRSGLYDTAEEAAACRKMVDADLDEVREPGMPGGQVLFLCKMFGRDPFIVTTDDSQSEPVKFSAWEYAEAKTASM